MCSVPMYSWLNRWASWLASCMTFRARSVNRSYMMFSAKIPRSGSTDVCSSRGSWPCSVFASANNSLSSFDFQFPFAGAFQSHQHVELSCRLVEPAGVPQQRRQHQPGVHVAKVSPQQAFQHVLRLVIIAFQIMVQRLGKAVSSDGSGPAAAARRPALPDRPAAAASQNTPKAVHKHTTQPRCNQFGPAEARQQQYVQHPRRAQRQRQSRPASVQP